jgi:hypothetical protein
MPESLLYSSSSFPLPENTTRCPRGGLTFRNEVGRPHNWRNGITTSPAERLPSPNERAPFPARFVRHRIQAQNKIPSDCERLAPMCWPIREWKHFDRHGWGKIIIIRHHYLAGVLRTEGYLSSGLVRCPKSGVTSASREGGSTITVEIKMA